MTAYDQTARTGAHGSTDPGADRSIGAIVGAIAEDMSSLIRQEMDLAKVEMKQEVTRVGKGAGMFGGAGAAGYLALFFLSFAFTWLLGYWLPIALAALITAAIWGVVAAVLAARGRQEIQEAHPQLPTTQRTLKEDVQWAKAHKS